MTINLDNLKAAVLKADWADPELNPKLADFTKEIGALSVETGVTVIYGVLTCDTIEQAIERAGLKSGNKGFEAAMAAIEMAQVMKQL